MVSTWESRVPTKTMQDIATFMCPSVTAAWPIGPRYRRIANGCWLRRWMDPHGYHADWCPLTVRHPAGVLAQMRGNARPPRGHPIANGWISPRLHPVVSTFGGRSSRMAHLNRLLLEPRRKKARHPLQTASMRSPASALGKHVFGSTT